MNDKELVALCVICRNQFTDEQIKSAKICPICSENSVPADPRVRVKLDITKHELRILTIWASNHANEIDLRAGIKQGPKLIAGIIHGIREQVPDVGPLTLDEEIGMLRKNFPGVKTNIPKDAVLPPKRSQKVIESDHE